MSDTKKPAARSPALEHAPEATRREAQQLLARASNPDEAQRAVESAVGQPGKPTSQKDAFARRWNFGSYLEIFEASKPLATIDGKHWLATNTGGDRWIVWNEEDLTAAYTVGSVQEAEQLIGANNSGRPGKATTPPTG